MSDKPVYQSQTGGVWHDVTDKEYAFRRELSGVYKTRILYPAADYEALKEKLERLNGLYHSEVSKHQLDYNALKAENEAIQKELTHWKANHADLKERLHVATHRTDLPSDRLPLFDRLKAENEAQAKRIAELERSEQQFIELRKVDDAACSGYVKEIESLRKQVEEHKEWHMKRDEMRKALEAQMNEGSCSVACDQYPNCIYPKNGDSK